MTHTIKTGLAVCGIFQEVGVETHFNHSHTLKLSMVGLPDTSIKESKERIISSLRSLGIKLSGELVVNLSPSDLKKDGTALDLPIAVSVLSRFQVNNLPKEIFDSILLGELGLDGSVKPSASIIPTLIAAYLSGFQKFVIPVSSKETIKKLPIKAEIWFIGNLRDLYHKPSFEITQTEAKCARINDEYVELFNSLNPTLQRAVYLSLVGGHSIFFIGPPGQGKTFTANLLAKLLPPMQSIEILECFLYHSLAGEDYSEILEGTRPFRAPHHSVTRAALIGGGAKGRPGEVTLANNGVLFLDELGEFTRSSLDSLRIPLETKRVKLARANYIFDLPANFLLVCASNPCPCGYFGSRSGKCRCTFSEVRKYLGRFSGPFLERLDIHVFIDWVENGVFNKKIFDLDLVEQLREIQVRRFGSLISNLDGKEVIRQNKELAQTIAKFTSSTRSAIKYLKLAMTNSLINGRNSASEEDFISVKNFRRLEKILDPVV